MEEEEEEEEWGGGSRRARGRAPFSIIPQLAPSVCPFDFKWYVVACVLPLSAAIVALSLPPFLLFSLLALIAFCVQTLLRINLLNKDVTATRTAGMSWEPWELLVAAIYLVLFAPGVYLLGPCWVLRATPWTPLLPSSSANHRFSARLPSPVKHPRELMWRNWVCVGVPMLAAGLAEHLLPHALLSDLSLSPSQRDWVGGAEALEWLDDAAITGRILYAFLIVVSLFLTVFNLRLTYRAGELPMLLAVYALLALSLLSTTLVLAGTYQLRLRQYMLWASFLPFTAHDNHISAACQGVLLGLSIRGLVVFGAEPTWILSTPAHF
mmetsp:Transcript_22960/g.46353  ORF Transcript_22960/g.46353 Transcript_22960/m.46353 type:complete len:323 (+) Transcript_22960:3-971(+)